MQCEDLTVIINTQKHTHIEVEVKVRSSDEHACALVSSRDKAINWRSHSPVVYLVGGWEAFSGPVEETVEEDEPGKACPNPHDHVEGHTCIVDDLVKREWKGCQIV